jgi:hypothetical protein
MHYLKERINPVLVEVGWKPDVVEKVMEQEMDKK